MFRSALRVMTYNAHGCLGWDGKISPARIAGVIARSHPDVVCLQELSPAKEAEQAAFIARTLAMTFHYHATYENRWGRCGNAILSRLPMKLVKNGFLPRLPGNPLLEPRGALWVEVAAPGGRSIQIVQTHLSLFARERRLQIAALLGPDWTGGPACAGPTVFCGDFNASPVSAVLAPVRERFKNCQTDFGDGRVLKTYPGVLPMRTIDHIFLDRGMKPVRVEVPRSGLEMIASDHLPLVAEIEWADAPGCVNG